MTELSFRTATEDDAGRLVDIYRPHITELVTSFEETVPSVDDFAQRISRINQRHLWLVAELENQIVGYAYGSSHRERAAYQYAVETSVYLDSQFQGRGVGTAIYTKLLDKLRTMGYYQAFAGITLPNESSQALHAKLGFESIGVFRKVGFKFGAWRDVYWCQLSLRDDLPSDI